jgi:hypothetical protein
VLKLPKGYDQGYLGQGPFLSIDPSCFGAPCG